MPARLLTKLLLLLTSLLLPVLVWAADAPRVVASVLPIHSLVSAVMKGIGQPSLLMDGSVSPHGFALRPSDARALERADLIVWLGPALERSLVRTLASKTFSGHQLALLSIPNLKLLPIRDGHDHSHDHNHGHKHSHDQDDPDPHAWLDPRNAIAMVNAIEATLIEIDPANAKQYQINARNSRTSLGQLVDELMQASESLSERRAGVFHDVLQYYERFTGLGESLVINRDPDLPAKLGQMGRVTQDLKNGKVPCLFAEPQFDGRLVSILVERYGLRQGIIDPLGANIEPGPLAYGQLMRQLSDQVRGCLLSPAT